MIPWTILFEMLAILGVGLVLARLVRDIILGMKAKLHLAAALGDLRTGVAPAEPIEAALEKAVASLAPTDQKYVRSALQQDSMRGRQNYIGDVMAAARGREHARAG